LEAHGLGRPVDDRDLLRQLDLAAPRLDVTDASYREGMKFFEQRARRTVVTRYEELQDAS
jgi:hypothetical protein